MKFAQQSSRVKQGRTGRSTERGRERVTDRVVCDEKSKRTIGQRSGEPPKQ
jgi:hypothetical protein